MKIHNRSKFHLYSICGFQVVNAQMVSWQSSSHKMAQFEGFLGPFSPKYCRNLLKFWPEVIHHKKTTVYEQSCKIMSLRGNGAYPKFTVLVQFWVQFTLGKFKTMPKTNIFPETASLELSNNASSRSHTDLTILV